MAKIKSLEDLQNWREYRVFLRKELKGLPEAGQGEGPVFITKDEVEFDLGGKPFSSHAVLFGDQAVATMKAIKKEGVLFREGTCHLQGENIGVRELSGGLLRGANLTLKRMALGAKLVPSNGAEADSGEANGTNATVFAKLKKKVFPRVKAAVAENPSNRSEIVKLAQKVRDLDKAKDYDGAVASIRKLSDELETAKKADAKAEKPSTSSGDEKLFKKRKAKVVPRLKQVAAKAPEQKGALNRLAKAVAAAEKASDYPRALESLDELVDAMKGALAGAKDGADAARVAEQDDETADTDSLELQDWPTYVQYMRVELKKLKADGMPIYISRKPAEFRDGASSFKTTAILAGKRARTQMKRFQREGVRFDEGIVRGGSKALTVDGLESSRVRLARRTLKRTHLGYRISLPLPETVPPEEIASAIEASMASQAAPPQPVTRRAISNEENAALEELTEAELRDVDLTQRDANELFTDEYMDGLVGLKIQVEDKESLAEIMRQLEDGVSGARRTELIAQLAEQRGGDAAKLDADYGRFLVLRDQQAAFRKANGGDVVPSLAEDMHGDFMASNPQLVFGKVVGDAFGIDPVFGALLSPTGGMVGPGNIALHLSDDDPTGYHGIVHDAAGYLANYHDKGPGYDYLDAEDRDSSDPLTGQQSGMRYWHEKLDPGVSTKLMCGTIDVVYAGKDGIEAAVELAKKGKATAEEAFNDALIAAEKAAKTARDTVTDAIDDAIDVIQDRMDDAKDGVSEIVDRATDAAGDAADAARRVAEETVSTVADAAREVAEAASDARESVTDTVVDAVETARDAASDVAEAAAEKLSDAWDYIWN